jgi:hypothetical protein
MLDDGEEVGGGVFLPVECIDDAKEALQAAMDNVLDWMNSHADQLQGVGAITKIHHTGRPAAPCRAAK